ncbi:sensor histidine kinase [Novosphingobium sp. Leaf2]|uniref:sensor histidine kinase n=1 Tax=Novosphingobium sp. Leaf2 TaxID=1735670 RepID=UPI0006F4455F|nr:HAMP domain-containing sensor histidine kinase [Novosphingobium sp. Leaf2]KQM17379.1 histidine kinase [Novosphingobium sp. Leaf2]
MTSLVGTILAHASTDGQDRLTAADEPLAGLQTACGGELPGAIAIPELRDLVRAVRQSGLALTKAVNAQDGADAVVAWMNVEPGAPDGGCTIRVRSWQTSPVLADDSSAAARRRVIDRGMAELQAYLDGGQRVLAAITDSTELANLCAAMNAGAGTLWTDFLPPENVHHHQPLHWRLLDDTRVSVPGSARSWRVALLPQMQPGHDASGFELLLLSDDPPQLFSQAAPPNPLPPRANLIGGDLAPVLRQPIARIVANAETIRTRLAGPLPDAYADYAGEIASAGKLLLDLLEDMSDLEVVEAEGFTTHPDSIDLAEVAQQAAGILGVRAREKAIAIDLDMPEHPVLARAEFRRVLQILLNLIGNAIRYAPASSRIGITLRSSGDRVGVVVSDQGPGLSADDQHRIFEKFERLGRSGDGGSGLGLYISRRLAEAMGGALTVESAPGEGAAFLLALPPDTDA